MSSRAAVKDACGRALAAMRSGDTPAGLRLYEYARRLDPTDNEVALAIAGAHFSLRRRHCIEQFAKIVRCDDVPEAWLGLIAARHRFGETAAAADDLRDFLSRHGHVRGTPTIRLHDAITARAGEAGWCALSATGQLRVMLLDAAMSLDHVVILLDAAPIGVRPRRRNRDGGFQRAIYQLPAGWRRAGEIGVCCGARHLLGSPLRVPAISQVEGFVRTQGGAIAGWAWHPNDPDCAVTLTLCDVSGATLRVVAIDPALDVAHSQPLARPRSIGVSTADVRRLRPPLTVLDASGRPLLGSPLDPLAEQRSAAGAAELARRRFPASGHVPGGTIELDRIAVPADIAGVRAVSSRTPRPPGVDVVIPVYRGYNQTIACIDSVLASLPPDARCCVVEDASPDTRLVDALRELAARGRIVLLRQPANRGFPATANAGLRAVGERDAILLNNDTLVPPGWIERLAEAAYGAPDIGTATPLSNEATIFSYPRQDGPNPTPDQAATTQLDRLARRANGGVTIDVPSANGFCVYIRHDCLASVGLLREDLFAQGYCEENDFCLRARHLGWRHVAAAGVFVGHVGAGSFGSAREQLLASNLATLNRLHPGYDALVEAFREADTLAPARFAIDALRWRRGCSRKGAAIIVTHGRAGGVQRHVAERCQALIAAGLRAIVLTPKDGACVLSDASGEDFPNLSFDDMASLAAFLRDEDPAWLELHHFIGHDPTVLKLAGLLGVPYDVVVHDYGWVCPSITFIGPDRRYCGEPGGSACEACYADIGGSLEEDIAPARLRIRSRGVLEAARHVVVPSQDVARRLANYFPRVTCTVRPWEDDALPAPRPAQRVKHPNLRVAVVGAIGIDKGFEYLLACARHAAARRLALEFVLVGRSCDDKRLLDTGTVSIVGPYQESEAVALIRAQEAGLGFLPALWPETWSYTLSQMWQAGLEVLAFDIGAPAERIRQTGRGSLLPLGLPPAAACSALLSWRGEDVSQGTLANRRKPAATCLAG